MRVCITGYGVICPSGLSVPALMAQMLAHSSSIVALPAVPEYGLGSIAGGVCPDDFAVPGVPAHKLLGVDRVSLFSVAAAQQALAQAAAREPLALDELPLIWGTSVGGFSTLDTAFRDLFALQKKRVRPTTVPYTMPSAAAFHVAHLLGVLGPSTTLSVACSSSALAIAQGARQIAAGEVDAVLVGGTESMQTPAGLRGWQMSQAIASADPTDPARSCRPFSADRCGFAISEGSASLVLESEASAARRGATVLGWVLGHGHTTDAAHISRPDSPAQAKAMAQALARSGVRADQLCYVNAHGTATAAGDSSEAQALVQTLGAFAASVPVSSTKALHGHMIGGSGALEAIVTV
ncbi:MAG: beta-ketoacyl-[acyl-carrier-protein] synthase family protein [Aquabacterium sp.]|nr:beta-ketoacyl-[acyl-carrier-protein] synthase family protein [Aquabacterium sp.]